MAKQTIRVMVDLETLSTESNAAIIQFGAAWKQGDMYRMEQVSVSPELYRDLQGFHIDQNTINFHYAKNRENYEECLRSEMTLQDLARIITLTFDDVKSLGTVEFWAGGTDFEIPILRNFFAQWNTKLPFLYYRARDYRTLRELYKKEVPLKTVNDHSAGSDAMNQLRHLEEILNYLGKEL